jgi:hypothetical protein
VAQEHAPVRPGAISVMLLGHCLVPPTPDV